MPNRVAYANVARRPPYFLLSRGLQVYYTRVFYLLLASQLRDAIVLHRANTRIGGPSEIIPIVLLAQLIGPQIIC